MFFRIFFIAPLTPYKGSVQWALLGRSAPFEIFFKKRCDKQCFVSSNCTFLQIFFCKKWFHKFHALYFVDFRALRDYCWNNRILKIFELKTPIIFIPSIHCWQTFSYNLLFPNIIKVCGQPKKGIITKDIKSGNIV